MGLDLLLINPCGSKKRIYQKLSENFSAIEPPFWASLTAGFVKNQGFNVDILDANAKNLDFKETVGKIENYNPSLINIIVYGQHPSASTQLMTDVGELCRIVKEKNPERRILLSGLHPSALPERTIKEEAVDFVCEGEGFYTLLGLLGGESNINIPGLWWKEKEKIFRTERAANTKDLAETLGDPAWDLILRKQLSQHPQEHLSASV